MPNEVKSHGNGLLFGLIIGGAIGAISTLLLAPKSGAEIRESLSNRYRDLADKTGELASTIGDKSQKIAHTVGAEAADLFNQAKQGTERVADKLRSAKDEVEEQVAATAESRG